MPEKMAYHLKGVLLGACNCDWGCPCNFEAPPSQGSCEGGYLWHLQEGVYGHVRLDGLNFAVYAHSPGPLHLGNVTSLYLVEEEPATLLKPKGFTSKQQELCSTAALRLTTEGLSFDHGGKYGEFSLFEYQGA